MIMALSLVEQGFRDLISPTAFVRAGGFFENLLYGLQVGQGGTLRLVASPALAARLIDSASFPVKHAGPAPIYYISGKSIHNEEPS